MALKGDLASVDLAQVFQMLALNQKVGMLCISSPRGWRALYFEPRGASLYFDEHVLLDKVVNQATRNGHLFADAVREARSHAVAQGVGLADALIAGGYLTEAELTVMLRGEMEEEIYDLFFWTEATFEFYEGATSVEGRHGHVDSRFVFSTDTLIMEAARRIDEWSFIQDRIAGPLEIFRPVGNPANVLDLEDSALALYDLVDGKRNVARLVEITGLPAFLVYKGLAVLLDEGLVELVPGEDLLATAAECEAEGRHQDAINVYEKAVALGEGVPDSHARAARVYETLQEFELATYHHKCVAEFCAQGEDIKRAVEIFKHVVDVLPTDLAARERLVALTVGRADLATRDFDPVANGKELVDLYLEIGEIERVRSILERLLRDNPFDVELKKSLINVHSKAGDSKRVVELYESIAEDLVQHRKPLEAIKYLQKILMLDRSRKDIAERIRSLYVMDERRRNRRRSMTALCLGLFLVVGLGVAWWFYDQHARDRLVTVQARVEKALETASYDGALGEYRSFKEQFPLTLVAEELDSEISRIESLQLRHQQQLQLEHRRREEALGRLRQQYKGLWEAVPRLIAEDDLDGALQKAEEVRKIVDEAGQAVDLAWANQAGLDRELQRIRTYIASAFELDRRARASLQAGDWVGARDLTMQAIEKYGMSRTVRAARLPVEIRSRPEGAEVHRAGVPMVDAVSGAVQRTPCVVLLGHGAEQELELRLEGFSPRRVALDPKARPTVDLVMEAIPAETLRFEEPVRGAISARRGYLAAGLRGGRVAIVRVEDGRRIVHRLAGLDELEGRVALTPAAAIFATREGLLMSVSLTSGEPIWTMRPPARPSHDILVHNGRVLFVDERGRFVAVDAAKGGEPLWFVPSQGITIGEPVASGRFVFLALARGEVLMIDAIDGGIAERVQCGASLAVGPVEAGGTVVVGTDDGRVLALRMGNGQLLWEHRLPASAVADRLVLVQDSILVRTNDHRLVSLDLRDGTLAAATQVAGRIVSGPVVGDDRVVIVTRGLDAAEDVLRAHRLVDLELAWEFRDGGLFPSGLDVHGANLFLPDSKGDVLRFR